MLHFDIVYHIWHITHKQSEQYAIHHVASFRQTQDCAVLMKIEFNETLPETERGWCVPTPMCWALRGPGLGIRWGPGVRLGPGIRWGPEMNSNRILPNMSSNINGFWQQLFFSLIQIRRFRKKCLRQACAGVNRAWGYQYTWRCTQMHTIS